MLLRLLCAPNGLAQQRVQLVSIHRRCSASNIGQIGRIDDALHLRYVVGYLITTSLARG